MLAKQLTYVLCGNRPWNRSHRPVGHDRNRGGQIKRNLPEISPIVQEGPQCSGHELRSLHVQSWRLTLYKPHNIACTETREPDSSRTKTAFEETADERNVVDNRRPAPARALPANTARMPRHNAQPESCWRVDALFAGDQALPAQKVDEMSEGRSISLGKAVVSSAIS